MNFTETIMKNLFKKTLLLSTLLFINNVSAVDGVIELNHTCATQTGCFSGDSAGFPITIFSIIPGLTVPGLSFRLTSDLILDDENISGLIIGIRNVTIDFNGFSLIRQACYQHQCTSVSGSGHGVKYVNSTLGEGATLKNGPIIGMGNDGVSLPGKNIIIENMQIGYSGGHGIHLTVGESALTKGNVIRKNTMFKNAENGININGSAMITGNIVDSNGGDGVECINWCNINNNIITSNNGDGVTVIGSTTKGSLVLENTISGNDLFGIRFGNGSVRSAYKGNFITNNFSGTVSGTKGFDLGQNFCTSNDTCP